jgi:hypothetical protein
LFRSAAEGKSWRLGKKQNDERFGRGRQTKPYPDISRLEDRSAMKQSTSFHQNIWLYKAPIFLGLTITYPSIIKDNLLTSPPFIENVPSNFPFVGDFPTFSHDFPIFSAGLKSDLALARLSLAFFSSALLDTRVKGRDPGT